MKSAATPRNGKTSQVLLVCATLALCFDSAHAQEQPNGFTLTLTKVDGRKMHLEPSLNRLISDDSTASKDPLRTVYEDLKFLSTGVTMNAPDSVARENELLFGAPLRTGPAWLRFIGERVQVISGDDLYPGFFRDRFKDAGYRNSAYDLDDNQRLALTRDFVDEDGRLRDSYVNENITNPIASNVTNGLFAYTLVRRAFQDYYPEPALQFRAYFHAEKNQNGVVLLTRDFFRHNANHYLEALPFTPPQPSVNHQTLAATSSLKPLQRYD